jgi:hypothetical protein
MDALLIWYSRALQVFICMPDLFMATLIRCTVLNAGNVIPLTWSFFCLQHEDKLRCPLNSGHILNSKSIDQHVRYCEASSKGYTKKELVSTVLGLLLFMVDLISSIMVFLSCVWFMLRRFLSKKIYNRF